MKAIINQLRDSYTRPGLAINHLREGTLPSRAAILEGLSGIKDLLFPDHRLARGIRGPQLDLRVGGLLEEVHEILREQICRARGYMEAAEQAALETASPHDAPTHPSAPITPAGTACGTLRCGSSMEQADADARAFLARLPDLRLELELDAQAALDGDPAAKSADEVIFCYPGFAAIVTYRIAHELLKLGVPLLPRIMTEYAHSRTGCDIHPGARIGPSFFIDHATGVVIGETTIIGERVKLYQGVTLGALSFPKDEQGRLLRNTKRHPTIEDDVVIYAGATVLGGDTTIGRGSVIGGSCWITHAIPPGTKVLLQEPQMKFRGPTPDPAARELDWEI